MKCKHCGDTIIFDKYSPTGFIHDYETIRLIWCTGGLTQAELDTKAEANAQGN